MSDHSNDESWLSQPQVIHNFRQRGVHIFDSLTAADKAAQKTPINLRYLIHTIQLTLTERLVVVLRALYEQGEMDLEDFRYVLLDMVRADQRMGSQVGQLTVTRLVWLARLANTAGGGSRDSFTFRHRHQVQLDANGRVVGYQRVSTCSFLLFDSLSSHLPPTIPSSFH